MLPATDGQRTGPAVRRPVPAFHGLDRKSVADAYAVKLKWLSQRSCVAFGQNRIARDRNAIRAQVLAKRFDMFQTADAGHATAHTTTGSLINAGCFLGRNAIASAPARARVISSKKPVRYAPLWSRRYPINIGKTASATPSAVRITPMILPSTRSPNNSPAISGIIRYSPPKPMPNTAANRSIVSWRDAKNRSGIALPTRT